MEITAGLKQMEATLSMVCDHTNAMKAKLEDLLFRAQRIAAAQKNNMGVTDTMFGYALQHIRQSDHKIEAFYLSNVIEELVMRAQGLPTTANKIVIITQTPPKPG